MACRNDLCDDAEGNFKIPDQNKIFIRVRLEELTMYRFNTKKAHRFTRLAVLILAVLALALVPVLLAVQPPVAGAASTYNAQAYNLATPLCVDWLASDCTPIETNGYAWNG
jgi:hypothetical protein